MKDQTNPSEFLSSLGQAQTALCAGCWQAQPRFRQSPKGVETRASGKLPLTWCSEMEFFFFPNFETIRDWGCLLMGLLQADDLFIRVALVYTFFRREFVVEGSSDMRSPRPCVPVGPQPSPRGEQ